MKVAVAKLEAFCIDALRTAGVSEADARATAGNPGAHRYVGCLHARHKKFARLHSAHPGRRDSEERAAKIVREGPAWAIVDADSGLGMVGSTFAMRTAIAKARSAGIGYVGIHNSCHFGAAGCYAAMAASENMIGLAMANDTPTMTVPGGRGLILGNNPFACAIPTSEKHPILLDIAMSVAAGGKVFTAAAAGQKFPETWMIDSEGRPTTDPTLFPHAGALLPMGGHKGYGLALMIETFSAILTGASIAGHVLSWSFSDASLPTGHGAAFIAVDVNTLMPVAEFTQRMKQTIREIRAAPKVEGSQIYLPGEMEWTRRETALREGIEMPDDVLASLRSLAGEMGLDISGLST